MGFSKNIFGPYLWKKGFAGVSDLQNVPNLDKIEGFFVFGIFYVAKKQAGQYLTHFY